MSNQPHFCPYCGKRNVTPTVGDDHEPNAFIEMGEYRDDAYEVEGDANTFKCNHCDSRYVLFAYDLSDFKSTKAKCPTCLGKGRVPDPAGILGTSTCPQCAGEGLVPDKG